MHCDMRSKKSPTPGRTSAGPGDAQEEVVESVRAPYAAQCTFLPRELQEIHGCSLNKMKRTRATYAPTRQVSNFGQFLFQPVAFLDIELLNFLGLQERCACPVGTCGEISPRHERGSQQRTWHAGVPAAGNSLHGEAASPRPQSEQTDARWMTGERASIHLLPRCTETKHW